MIVSLDEKGLPSILWYKMTSCSPFCQDILLSTSSRRQWLGCYDSDYLHVQINRLPAGKCFKGNLKVGEITRATKEIVRVIQRKTFPKELAILQRTPQESTTPSSDRKSTRGKLNCIGYASPLRTLSPSIHDGIICVGGRLNRAPIPFSAKHPMILPSKHPVSDLIIKDYHEKEGHVGASHVLASLRQKFWILRGHAAVRRVIGKCIKCPGLAHGVGYHCNILLLTCFLL